MKEFRAFPSTVVEVNGEIEISYQAGNNNEPRYNNIRMVDIGGVCMCATTELIEEGEQ